jgi:hypothetical protein
VRRRSCRGALACLAAAGLAVGAAANASDGGAAAVATEYWDITARFESGERIFARSMITSDVPGSRNAVTTGNLVYADGRVVPFRKGKLGGDWSLQGRRLEIGKSVLDRSGAQHLFSFGSEKYGVDLELRFAPEGPVADGADAGPEGYASEVLEMGTPVEGWYRVSGMDEPRRVAGTLALTHTRTRRNEAELALRRIEFLSLREGAALYVSDLTTPAGARARWLAVRSEGRILYRSAEFDVWLGPDSPDVGDRAYPFPTSLQIRNDDLRGEIRLANVLVEQDLFEGLPLPFRLLLSLRLRPHRVWTESPFEVELGTGPHNPPFELRGTGIASVTFLNPIPSPE